MNTTLRQWCPACRLITRTWMDIYGHLRCSGCDPESGGHPGYGVRDYTEEEP